MALAQTGASLPARPRPSVPALLGLLLALLLAALPGRGAAQTFRFESVTIEGLQRIEPGTVLSYAQIPRGQPVTAGELNAAFQRLMGSGLFETVELIPDGSRLIIRVAEFPTINIVAFEGNRRLDDEALAAIVQSQSRRIYSPSVAEQDAARITEAYAQEGRLAATVTPRIIRRSDNRVDLVFEIVEGRVVEIERLSFVGNRAFGDRRLREVLATKQAGLLRQFVRRDTFVAERIELDKQLLRDFYLSRGFIDFQVLSVSSELTRQRDAFLVTFTLREGQQFRFGEITVTSEVAGADPAVYEREVRVRPGRVYNPLDVENTIARLETLALRQGLDFVRVEPRITRNDRLLTLDIEFAVVRGPRIFVERIDIEGNVTTLDQVVRRQFRTVEGDPFNPREIREAAERIRALGFFSNAEVEAREGSAADQVVVDVNVEEQPTGSLGFGLSYGVASGAALAVNFSETNFLGRGQTLAFNFDTGTTNRTALLTFVEPAFLDRDLRFRFSAGWRETNQDFSFYRTRSGNLGFGFEFPAGELSRLGVNYAFRFDEIFGVDDGFVDEDPEDGIDDDPDDNGSSPILQREQGSRFTSAVGWSYSYDSRIGGLSPRGGVLLRFGQELAGLGGDNRYVRSTLTALAETRIRNEEVTLRAVLEGGALAMLDGTSRVTDRFFGQQMRGFEPRGIGPRDLGATNDDPLGGNYFAVLKLETEFPLGIPEEYGLSGGAFVDVGSVWGLDDTAGYQPVDDSLRLRAAAGFSLFWNTPLGPLRFNFSTPLMKEPYDKEQNFDLTISTRF
jgi:outer membrane protein insertion porin family